MNEAVMEGPLDFQMMFSAWSSMGEGVPMLDFSGQTFDLVSINGILDVDTPKQKALTRIVPGTQEVEDVYVLQLGDGGLYAMFRPSKSGVSRGELITVYGIDELGVARLEQIEDGGSWNDFRNSLGSS